MCLDCETAAEAIESLRAQLAKVTAERDAAVECMKKYPYVHMKACLHYPECYKIAYDSMKIMGCVGCDRWEWRG